MRRAAAGVRGSDTIDDIGSRVVSDIEHQGDTMGVCDSRSAHTGPKPLVEQLGDGSG
ncbi:hypothetical protein CY34DRAFT_810725 [Suillus luteus UH-Slu-Lm8-n1]|uniref:Uncharacterized protein n=1 Tax=Suillus luteus UH-Slu-Lm8-n1 TaxID=930992 RepID=A0A0D0AS54_9AGAM|nr:hypothetical protein CY34DRAFT_810725 [Suillus luteus UH-Slu-Lm8-n1]